MDFPTSARRYYDAVDGDDYDTLASLLAPAFVHRRPDRTIEGREAFVSFMREDRPMTETAHEVDAVYVRKGGENGGDGGERGRGDEVEVAARGRLLDDAGGELFAFVDVFRFDAGTGEAVELRTFTH